MVNTCVSFKLCSFLSTVIFLYILHRSSSINCSRLLFRCFSYRIDTKRLGAGLRAPGEHWSGEATRGGGFAVQEARVDVTIGEEERTTEVAKKERPVWMVESTVITNDPQASLLTCLF